ncbi:MAG: NAD-dependent epimerase/dehydratase family protein, partial [Actinomycetia bacterium]|nr:NAD-dependent epimerase/dehydratase family protein [Actinomycetes bacterium]
LSTFLITGAAGYLAGRIIEFLSGWECCGRLVGIDARPEPPSFPSDSYYQVDIRSPETTRILLEESPDVVIHLAYAVDPLHDTSEEQSVNIGGLRRVLAGVEAAGCRQFLVASSTTAYGAYPGIPTFQDEDCPVRIHPRLPYARDKVLTELMCRRFQASNPGVKVTVIRPAIVVGPNWSNLWAVIFFALPVIPRAAGHDTMFQFIHEDDLVQLWRLCIEQEAAGTFNAAADGALTLQEIAEMVGKPTFPFHRSLMEASMWLMHRSRLLPVGTPPALVDFFCYPWVVSNRKARGVLGFTPAYDSREAFAGSARMQAHLLENLARKDSGRYRLYNAFLEAAIARAGRNGNP